MNSSFQVSDIFSILGRGSVVTGKLLSGIAKKGMKCQINGKQSEILAIEVPKNSLETLTPGIEAGLLLSNIEKNDTQKGAIINFQQQ